MLSHSTEILTAHIYKVLCTADVDGHYVFLKGSIGNIRVTMATVYAPNKRQDVFIRHVLDTLWEFSEG